MLRLSLTCTAANEWHCSGPSTHPIEADELRLLRRLRRSCYQDPFVFASERGGPLSRSTISKLVTRVGERMAQYHPQQGVGRKHVAGESKYPGDTKAQEKSDEKKDALGPVARGSCGAGTPLFPMAAPQGTRQFPGMLLSSGRFPVRVGPEQENDTTVYRAGKAVVDSPPVAHSGFVLDL